MTIRMTTETETKNLVETERMTAAEATEATTLAAEAEAMKAETS